MTVRRDDEYYWPQILEMATIPPGVRPCPRCGEPLTAFRGLASLAKNPDIPDLHLICESCGGKWTVSIE